VRRSGYIRIQGGQLGDLGAQNIDVVGEEREGLWIGRSRMFRRPAYREHQRTRQRRLECNLRAGARVDEFLGRQRAPPAEPAGYGERHRQIGYAGLAAATAAHALPSPRVERDRLETLHVVGQRRDEAGAAHFAVGHDVHA
jgi:hypothetical protein